MVNCKEGDRLVNIEIRVPFLKLYCRQTATVNYTYSAEAHKKQGDGAINIPR